jgi:ABC-2 type transport system permease protein
MLTPLDRSEQVFWEYLNYALALAGLALVYWLHRRGRARRQQHYEEVMTGGRT